MGKNGNYIYELSEMGGGGGYTQETKKGCVPGRESRADVPGRDTGDTVVAVSGRVEAAVGGRSSSSPSLIRGLGVGVKLDNL